MLPGAAATQYRPSIPALTSSCLNRFSKLTQLLCDQHDKSRFEAEIRAVQDHDTRFRLWVANIGAHHSDGRSMDARLKGAPEISERLAEILGDLRDDLNEAYELVSESAQSDVELSVGSGSELWEIVDSVPDSITSLMEVSILIRKARGRDGYAKAAASTDEPLLPTFDILRVKWKFPKIKEIEWLCERLGNAVTLRRRYLRYKHQHRRQLGDPASVRPFTANASLRQASQTLDAYDEADHISARAQSLAPTKASTLNVEMLSLVEPFTYLKTESDADSLTTSMVSHADLDDQQLDIPSLTSLSKDGEHFECPYCKELVQHKKQRKFREHVMRDLRAYVCTFEDCTAGLFEDRHTWFQHEQAVHRRQWICRLCTSSGHTKWFISPDALHTHLAHVHNHALPVGLAASAILQASSRPLDQIPAAGACPLCDEWYEGLKADGIRRQVPEDDVLVVSARDLERHLASHHEQLSLFAVSRDDEEEEPRVSGEDSPVAMSSGVLHEWLDQIEPDMEEYQSDVSSQLEQFIPAEGVEPGQLDIEGWRNQIVKEDKSDESNPLDQVVPAKVGEQVEELTMDAAYSHSSPSSPESAPAVSGPLPPIQRDIAGGTHIDSVAAYTVAWIAPLVHERAAGESMFDEEHDEPEDFEQNASDINAYSWGRMGKHKVVIASLPSAEYGTNAAATVAQALRSSLPHVRIGLLVGIGAGIPGEQYGPDDKLELRRPIQLGDVAVSLPGNGTGGVIQFDLVAIKDSGGSVVIEQRGWLNSSPQAVRTALTALRAKHERMGVTVESTIEGAFTRYSNMEKTYCHPGLVEQPEARRPDIYHTRDGTRILREPRKTPSIHYGVVASSNKLVKSARARDTIMEELQGIDPICIEMEAAGLMNSFPCLVIRGICDYADEHKNDYWQKYAAMVAAAYAKEYLQSVNAELIMKGLEIEVLLKQVDARFEHVGAAKTRLGVMQRQQETNTLLDWISRYDHATEQNAKFAQWQPGTCQWFLQDETISAWMSGEVKAVYCPGPPGAGKSVMASLLVHHLQGEHLHSREHAVVKLYCDHTKQDLQDSVYFFSSILRQLLSRMSELDAVPHEALEWHKKHARRGTRSTEAEIKDVLRTVTDKFAIIHIVIDALDECDSSSRSRLLSSKTGLRSLNSVHMLATSRDHQEIASLLTPCPIVNIRAADDDVEAYLQDHLDRLPTFVRRDGDLVTRICTKVQFAADGLFLLARLHFDSFHGQTNIQEVEDRLAQLPVGGDAYKRTYDTAMERITAQSHSEYALAINVLSRVHIAKYPLRILELQHVLGTKKGQTSANPKLLPDIDTMLSACAGLVEAVEQEPEQSAKHLVRRPEDARVVRFAHYTIEEYFKDTAAQWFPKDDPVSTEAELYPTQGSRAAGHGSEEDWESTESLAL
ncbi:hypothetical protein LTR17_000198 [Elasticomyces elasticus]|nr:hypothetical protein LTR17_000198 [Elasticomyces elasticus]